jgi:zinc/manganese transport system substrate-binding protein
MKGSPLSADPRPLALFAAVAVAFVLAACGGGNDGEGDAEVRVAATTGVAADILSRVAGEDIEVVQIVPDGSNPHSYAPSASEQQELATSDLLVLFHPALEQALPLDSAENRFAIAEHAGEPREVGEAEAHADDGSAAEAKGGDHGHDGEADDHGHEDVGAMQGDEHRHEGDGRAGGRDDATEPDDHGHAHDAGEDDPHVWLDPLAIEAALPDLADALAEVDPEHAEDYRQRARGYANELERLDQELEAMVSEVPASDRKLVTSHELMGHFADRYGFEVVGAPFGTSPEAEASAGTVAELVDRVEAEQVPAVFAQQGDNPELLRMIAAEAGVMVVDDLLVESLGEQAGSYVEMMRYSTRRITDALSG